MCTHACTRGCIKLLIRIFCELLAWTAAATPWMTAGQSLGVEWMCITGVCRQISKPTGRRCRLSPLSHSDVVPATLGHLRIVHTYTHISLQCTPPPPPTSSSISTAAKQWRNVPACYHSSVAIWWRRARDNPGRPYQWQGSHFQIQAPLADKGSPW